VPEDLLLGRNSVLEALRAGRSLDKLLVSAGERKGRIAQILSLARERGVRVETVSADRMNSLAGGLPHQGVAAYAAPVNYHEVEEVLENARSQSRQPFLLLLAGLEDPRNVGAIIRTAAAAGVHGVLLPDRRACRVTPSLARASAGAVEYLPLVRIGNITGTLEKLKKLGLWVLGADSGGGTDYRRVDLAIPLVLVIGGEQRGLPRLVKSACDLLLNIPMPGRALSLNASVAAALLIYEVLRRREGTLHG
jgi:23S rRNA (guanosine2251-2'-O)-methyltransferase